MSQRKMINLSKISRGDIRRIVKDIVERDELVIAEGSLTHTLVGLHDFLKVERLAGEEGKVCPTLYEIRRLFEVEDESYYELETLFSSEGKPLVAIPTENICQAKNLINNILAELNIFTPQKTHVLKRRFIDPEHLQISWCKKQ